MSAMGENSGSPMSIPRGQAVGMAGSTRMSITASPGGIVNRWLHNFSPRGLRCRRSNFAIRPPSTWLATVDVRFRHQLVVYGVLGWILRLVRGMSPPSFGLQRAPASGTSHQ
uniref:Uncharacterized protein n=1 Tax=Zea mays TaxID=4577 RepID=A0A804QTY2_MAIZE